MLNLNVEIMRKVLYFVVFAALLGSCQKEEYVEQADPIVTEDGDIGFVSSTMSSKSGFINDTILVERGTKVEFQAMASGGLNIISWQWTFNDDGSHSADIAPSHYFNLTAGAVSSITLLGVDASGISHTRTKPVKGVWTLDGQDGFLWISSTLVSGNLYNVVCIAHKRAMIDYTTGNYAFAGDMTSPAWTTQTVSVSDTNWNYVGGTLVAAGPGAVGKYVAIRFTATPGDHQLAIGKTNNTGGLNWSVFWGPYSITGSKVGMIMATDGSVIPYTPITLPGDRGDEGRNAVVRTRLTDTSVIVYVNNNVALAGLTAPFVRFEDSTGVYQDVLTQTAVTGFPNWGQVEVKYNDFLMTGVLIFQFGSNAVVASNMSASSYFQTTYNNLKMQMAVTSVRMKIK